MTSKQKTLLARIRASGGCFLRGADVRVARALETLGLVTLEDYGEMKDPWNRVDGERWMATPVTKTEPGIQTPQHLAKILVDLAERVKLPGVEDATWEPAEEGKPSVVTLYLDDGSRLVVTIAALPPESV